MADLETEGSARRGPRASRGVVKADILAAARRVFTASGFRGTTLRDVAEAAGVDPRTIAYYFTDKENLLVAALQPPRQLMTGMASINDIPLEHRGRALVEGLLRTWSRPANRDLLALIIAIGQQHPAGLSGLDDVYRNRFIAYIAQGLSDEHAVLRAGLVAGEIVSVSVSRFVWRLEPLASLPHDTVVALVAPRVQHFLSGDLELPPPQSSSAAKH